MDGSVPPAWVAVIVTVPGPTMVAVDPLTVTTFRSELVNVMGSPDVALADRLMLDTEVLVSAISAKVIVWDRFSVMVRLKFTLVAASK